MPGTDILAIKAAAKKAFCHLAGVENVRLAEGGLRIYVRTKETARRLPREFQGLPICCVVTAEIGEPTPTPESPSPCAHCGSLEITARMFLQEYPWAILCLLCAARGPQALTEDAAWRLWNQRWMPSE